MNNKGLICLIIAIVISVSNIHPLANSNIKEPSVEVIASNNSSTETMLQAPLYTEEELNMLSHLIYAEGGSDTVTDEHQLAIGSVVLNRIADSRFPNTMKGVIFQKGQYACTWDGNYYKTPNQRAINNAKILLIEGSKIPANVIFQSQGRQGKGVWKKIQNQYFCY